MLLRRTARFRSEDFRCMIGENRHEKKIALNMLSSQTESRLEKFSLDFARSTHYIFTHEFLLTRQQDEMFVASYNVVENSLRFGP